MAAVSVGILSEHAISTRREPYPCHSSRTPFWLLLKGRSQLAPDSSTTTHTRSHTCHIISASLHKHLTSHSVEHGLTYRPPISLEASSFHTITHLIILRSITSHLSGIAVPNYLPRLAGIPDPDHQVQPFSLPYRWNLLQRVARRGKGEEGKGSAPRKCK